MDWVWVEIDVAIAAHDEQLAEHGGAAGTRDRSMLESAMARPLNCIAYEDCDIADLAAGYAFGIARSHPFVDGNKRTALVVSETFLMLNDHRFDCDNVEIVVTVLALAAGELSIEQLATWSARTSCRPGIRKCPPVVNHRRASFLPRNWWTGTPRRSRVVGRRLRAAGRA